MKNNDELYLGKKIQKALWNIDKIHYIMIRDDLYGSSEARNEILYRIRNTHYHILCFLEIKGLTRLLKQFEQEFDQSYLEDEKRLLKHDDNGIETYEPGLIILNKFRSYLEVFTEFDTPPIFANYNINGYEILEEILKNTQHIVENVKDDIKKEADIYSQVSWVLKMIFVSTRRLNKARVIKGINTYKPDILIPELKTAIEYKYIRIWKDLSIHLDQVKTDADNYTDDPEYNRFYAVFYISSQKLISEKAFLSEWGDKNFPSNWKAIVVFGKES